MSENQRVAGAASGALGLSAVAAMFGTCCVAPWAVGLLGVSGAVTLARLAFLQPYFIAGAGVLLGVAFWWAYRPVPVCADGSCETTNRRRLRWMLWLTTGVVAVLAAASFAPQFLSHLVK